MLDKLKRNGDGDDSSASPSTAVVDGNGTTTGDSDTTNNDKSTDGTKRLRLTREDLCAASTLMMGSEPANKSLDDLSSSSSTERNKNKDLKEPALIATSATATASSSNESSITRGTRSKRPPPKSAKDRHEAHILSEKRRREQINQGFVDLKQLIPICQYSFDTKAVILQKGKSDK